VLKLLATAAAFSSTIPLLFQPVPMSRRVDGAMQAQDIERLIEEQLPDARALVRGDDGVHFEAVVISTAFAGKTLIQQHRMVYAALGGRLEREDIHALSLKTYTPDAWHAAQS
jgi:acid stress-induced BolA-like protein IbaG/YrbA